MKKNILAYSLVFVLFCGCFFNTATAADRSSYISEVSYSANSYQRRNQKRRTRERLIIHRNSGKVRRAICRNGSISYSRNRRGTCSRNGGVRRWL